MNWIPLNRAMINISLIGKKVRFIHQNYCSPIVCDVRDSFVKIGTGWFPYEEFEIEDKEGGK